MFLERSYSDLVQACGNKVMRNETTKSILKESIIEIVSGKYKREELRITLRLLPLIFEIMYCFFPKYCPFPNGSDNDESAYSMGD